MFQVLYVTNLIMVIALSAFGLRNAFGLTPCNLSHNMAHLQFSVGGYPKIVLSRYMKNGRFDTPLS